MAPKRTKTALPTIFDKLRVLLGLVEPGAPIDIPYEDARQRTLGVSIILWMNKWRLVCSFQDLVWDMGWLTYTKLEFRETLDLLVQYKVIHKEKSKFSNDMNYSFNEKNPAACEQALYDYRDWLHGLLQQVEEAIVAVENDVLGFVTVENRINDIIVVMDSFNRFLSPNNTSKEFNAALAFAGAMQMKQDRIAAVYSKVQLVNDVLFKFPDFCKLLGMKVEPTPEMRNRLMKYRLSKAI